jgi:hypothetical protein
LVKGQDYVNEHVRKLDKDPVHGPNDPQSDSSEKEDAAESEGTVEEYNPHKNK